MRKSGGTNPALPAVPTNVTRMVNKRRSGRKVDPIEVVWSALGLVALVLFIIALILLIWIEFRTNTLLM